MYFLAIDIGASSGRHILGHLEDGKLKLEEVYRFDNGYHEEKDNMRQLLVAKGNASRILGIDTDAQGQEHSRAQTRSRELER